MTSQLTLFTTIATNSAPCSLTFYSICVICILTNQSDFGFFGILRLFREQRRKERLSIRQIDILPWLWQLSVRTTTDNHFRESFKVCSELHQSYLVPPSWDCTHRNFLTSLLLSILTRVICFQEHQLCCARLLLFHRLHRESSVIFKKQSQKHPRLLLGKKFLDFQKKVSSVSIGRQQ